MRTSLSHLDRTVEKTIMQQLIVLHQICLYPLSFLTIESHEGEVSLHRSSVLRDHFK